MRNQETVGRKNPQNKEKRRPEGQRGRNGEEAGRGDGSDAAMNSIGTKRETLPYQGKKPMSEIHPQKMRFLSRGTIEKGERGGKGKGIQNARTNEKTPKGSTFGEEEEM